MFHGWRRFAAPVALGLGPAIIVIAVLRNWHGWEAPPFWLDDFAAGLALLVAGVLALREPGRINGRMLSAAYALAVGVLWGSLFEPLAGLHPRPEDWSAFPVVSRYLTLLVMLVAAAGLAMSLPSNRPTVLGTRPGPEKKKARR